MKEYHKIRGVYKFDEKTHLPIQVIDEYFDPLCYCKWIFTEKIDWTNIRVRWDWHTIEIAGRTDKAELPGDLIDRIKYLFKEELLEQEFQDREVIFYGEWFWWKIQSWTNNYQKEKDFILFDVEIGGIRLKRDDVDGIASKLWIRSVPVLFMWTLVDWIEFMKWNIETYIQPLAKIEIEWIVWTPRGWFLDRMWHRIIVKIKQEHFKS